LNVSSASGGIDLKSGADIPVACVRGVRDEIIGMIASALLRIVPGRDVPPQSLRMSECLATASVASSSLDLKWL